MSNNIDIHLSETVKEINSRSNNDHEVITNKGTYKANKIIIATGGCTYPQTGSTGDGYVFCKDLEQPLTELYPAETFLISNNSLPLAGITLDNVILKLKNYTSTGSLLFTHLGISGPATFKISEKVFQELKTNSIVTLLIDFIPDCSENFLLEMMNNSEAKKDLVSVIKKYLPIRLINSILDENELKQKINFLSKTKKLLIIKQLKNFPLEIKATGSMEQSFVTGGGVNLKYINPKTMESTKNPGIYFVGELLDLHGHTGGYNITIALVQVLLPEQKEIKIEIIKINILLVCVNKNVMLLTMI
jgi:predicted Rossmann fold flavoprotein